jgi:hypothetical protein
VWDWPQMEMLRKETTEDGRVRVDFVVLAPFILRRPLHIDAHGYAWGAY